jgi:hypothetical protein
VRTVRQIRDDETGTIALRLAEGMTLKQLDPEAWAAAREVMEVHLGQMPSVAPVAAGAGVQPGVSFAGQRDPRRDDHLGKVALLAIAELATIAFNVLRGDEAPQEIRDRVNDFQGYVANMIRREIDAAQTSSISE